MFMNLDFIIKESLLQLIRQLVGYLLHRFSTFLNAGIKCPQTTRHLKTKNQSSTISINLTLIQEHYTVHIKYGHLLHEEHCK